MDPSSVRFVVLGSGSGGNASLLQVGSFGLLIDCGFGPRVLADRLSAHGFSWRSVSAVILTHTHNDHWHPLTIAHLRTLSIPLYGHQRHHSALSGREEYQPLKRAGLTRILEDGQPCPISDAITAYPARIPHDSYPTFAFRFEAHDQDRQVNAAIGFASDVGHTTNDLVELLTDVDLLALEFNHDIEMQRSSGRPALLIERVLGRHGHLSNAEAATLAGRIRQLSRQRRWQTLIQLHLSKDCNTPALAQASMAPLLAQDPGLSVISASQSIPTPVITLKTPQSREAFRYRKSVQPALPGLGDGVDLANQAKHDG